MEFLNALVTHSDDHRSQSQTRKKCLKNQFVCWQQVIQISDLELGTCPLFNRLHILCSHKDSLILFEWSRKQAIKTDPLLHEMGEKRK